MLESAWCPPAWHPACQGRWLGEEQVNDAQLTWAGSLRLHRTFRPEELIVNFIIWLIVGGLLGWVASIIMKTNAQQGMVLNVVVGIVGAMLGGWLLAPMFGVGTINQGDFSIAGLGLSLLGAVILLAIVNLIRRGKVT